MAHKHKSVKCEVRPYTGPVSSDENPVAHGNVCFVDHCACGAVQKTNSNNGQLERGEWHRED